MKVYEMADSWNNAAYVFTAIKMDVKDHACDAASLLMDLQVDTASKFSIGKDGGLTLTSGIIRSTTEMDAATYDVLATDDILHVTYTATGAVAITMPTDQVIDGRGILIKDAGGNAALNNIVIDTEGSETIDGGAIATINSDYAAIWLYSDGVNWFIY
jgi:hypothetical protein